MNVIDAFATMLGISLLFNVALLWRLESVQGPERHLVGDVAERIPRQGDVEEVEPGRRGVGEIDGATELRQFVERLRDKARGLGTYHAGYGRTVLPTFYEGKASALDEVLGEIDRTASQRSDLSNDEMTSPHETK